MDLSQSYTMEIAGVLEAKKQAVLQLLEEAENVVLVGEAGVGKTWLAREVCDSALALYKSYGTIWILSEDKYEASEVAENIARQLFIFPPSGELDEDGELDKEVYVKEDWSYHGLKDKISEKLGNMVKEVINKRKNASMSDANEPAKQQKDMKFATTEEKLYLLAVLDDVPTKDEAEIVSLLKDILKPSEALVYLFKDIPKPPLVLLKFLITRRNSADNAGPEENGDTIQQVGGERTYQVKPLSLEESQALLCERVGAGTSGMPILMKSDYVAKNSQGLPAAIVMIAQALRRAGLDQINEETCGIAMEGATIGAEPANVERLLTCAQEMLPSDVMKDCFWQSRQLFSKCCRIHYDELITYWILEGFFTYGEIDQSYEEAHNVLMELKDRCFLNGQGNNHISIERILNEKLSCHTHGGSSRAAYLGLANVLDDVTLLGKITRIDGMIKTRCVHFSDVSTLIIDGNRLFRENEETFFSPMKGLKVLAILNPKFESLPSSLFSLINLQVLVLRGCHLLKNIDGICQLTNLLSLEVSGARSLGNINSHLFKEMVNIRSVNLSEAGVEILPETLLNRPELRWLILRECKNLQTPPSLEDLPKLEVLDLSGAASLELLQDKLLELPELQTINLSRTKIRKLPILKALKKFTRLLLRDCRFLKILYPFIEVNALEIIDLSGAIALNEIRRDCLENKPKLRLLDLSTSGIIGSPLHLKDSPPQSQSTVLKLETLELLDLSGISSFKKIDGTMFEHLKLLRGLILSNTNVEVLPPLTFLAELRRLVLRDCKSLTKLEGLDALKRLEVIDLSGCKAVETSTNTSFRHMSFLRTLDLSETSVKQLPSDCFPSRLCILRLRNCSKLQQLPSVESLLQLEVLDLYGAESLDSLNTNFLLKMGNLQTLHLSKVPLRGLPSLSNLIKLKELSLQGCSHDVAGLETLTELELLDLSKTKIKSLSNICTANLQQLFLRDCEDLDDFTNLESFSHLEVLDLSGTRMRDFPYKILDFTHLRKLVLENMKEIGEIDWTKVNHLPQELNLGSMKSGITSASDKIPSIFICGAQFFQLLRNNEDLWQKCFRRFHFFVWLCKEDKKDGIGLCYRDTGFFRHFNSRRRFSFPREHDCSLEILGSDSPGVRKNSLGEAPSSDTPDMEKNDASGLVTASSTPDIQKDAIRQAVSAVFPNELKSALGYAEHVSLIDSSIMRLSQVVEENVNSLKSLWLERCNKIEYILSGGKDTELGEKIKDLYLSNLPFLRSLCVDSMQCVVFTNLKSLSLDSCPKLESILPMAKMPQNLETLQVKFCNKVETLIKVDASEEPKLLKLHSLELLDLPNLNSIGVSMPGLKTMKVKCCSKLEKLEKTLDEAESLEVLCISDMVRLETLCSGSPSSRGLKNLKMLKLESCPDITKVFTSSRLPSSLIELEIKCCDKLTTVCDGNLSDSCPFSSLSKLHLWKLPELGDNWGRVAAREGYCITECPKFIINR